ncbi:hypothetical protein F4778DRAFT_791542 [Xylariomycetidae sp. FL2044]|nr:hypothetical protein F4778DRAFT_791542 [Xylariomycetidae sp. FL2044]
MPRPVATSVGLAVPPGLLCTVPAYARVRDLMRRLSGDDAEREYWFSDYSSLDGVSETSSQASSEEQVPDPTEESWGVGRSFEMTPSELIPFIPDFATGIEIASLRIFENSIGITAPRHVTNTAVFTILREYPCKSMSREEIEQLSRIEAKLLFAFHQGALTAQREYGSHLSYCSAYIDLRVGVNYRKRCFALLLTSANGGGPLEPSRFPVDETLDAVQAMAGRLDIRLTKDVWVIHAYRFDRDRVVWNPIGRKDVVRLVKAHAHLDFSS